MAFSLAVILLALHFSCCCSFFLQSRRPQNSESFIQYRSSRRGIQWASLHAGQSIFDEETLKFLSWASAEGISASKCEVYNFPGGLRGLRAVNDIEENEVFLQVPLRLCLSSERTYTRGLEGSTTNRDSRSSRVVIDASIPGELPVLSLFSDSFEWPVALAIQIISESRLERSILAHYIATLPKAFDELAVDGDVDVHSLSQSLPLHWSNVRNIPLFLSYTTSIALCKIQWGYKGIILKSQIEVEYSNFFRKMKILLNSVEQIRTK